jgi:hypothetical protein
VQKSPNSFCVALALGDPSMMRSALLISAMHQAWLRGKDAHSELGDMEETYLYHKVEAMRIVNQGIAEWERGGSDGDLFLIAALALAEVSQRAEPPQLLG